MNQNERAVLHEVVKNLERDLERMRRGELQILAVVEMARGHLAAVMDGSVGPISKMAADELSVVYAVLDAMCKYHPMRKGHHEQPD